MYCLTTPSSSAGEQAYALVIPHICAVMKTGSLKALRVVGLFSQLAEQVLKVLPHCTQLRELELELDWSRSDKVRHVTLCPIHQQ